MKTRQLFNSKISLKLAEYMRTAIHIKPDRPEFLTRLKEDHGIAIVDNCDDLLYDKDEAIKYLNLYTNENRHEYGNVFHLKDNKCSDIIYHFLCYIVELFVNFYCRDARYEYFSEISIRKMHIYMIVHFLLNRSETDAPINISLQSYEKYRSPQGLFKSWTRRQLLKYIDALLMFQPDVIEG